MKIIVTGITGFIEKNFSKAVANNENQYVCLVRNTSRTENLVKAGNIKCSISDFSVGNLTESFMGADAVIHMIDQIGAYEIIEERFMEKNAYGY